MMKMVNLQQLILTEAMCVAYADFIDNHSKIKPYVHQNGNFNVVKSSYFKDIKRTKDPEESDLHPAFKAAINIYTSNYYSQMNSFLRGVKHADFSPQNPNYNQNMKEVVLHVAFASSALNSISDTHIHTSFRYDSSLPSNLLQLQIDSANAPVDKPIVFDVPAFISTAGGEPAADFQGAIQSVYCGLTGKDVRAFSMFENEREFLMNPTQMMTIAHRGDSGVHSFLFMPVNSIVGEKNTPVKLAIYNLINKIVIDFLSKIENLYEKQKEIIDPFIKTVNIIKYAYFFPSLYVSFSLYEAFVLSKMKTEMELLSTLYHEAQLLKENIAACYKKEDGNYNALNHLMNFVNKQKKIFEKDGEFTLQELLELAEECNKLAIILQNFDVGYKKEKKHSP